MFDQVKFTDELKAISETLDLDEQAARGWHMNVLCRRIVCLSARNCCWRMILFKLSYRRACAP